MPPSPEQVVQQCNQLLHGEFEMIAAYNEAIRQVPEPALADRLEALRLENQQHVHDLSAVVRRLGGMPADPGGVGQTLRTTFTRLAAIAGAPGILRALSLLAEELLGRYDGAMELDAPGGIGRTLSSCRANVQRHCDWLRRAREERIWEEAPQNP